MVWYTLSRHYPQPSLTRLLPGQPTTQQSAHVTESNTANLNAPSHRSLARVCAHYGLSSVSARSFFKAYLQHGQHTARGLTECQLFGQIYHDRIHPGRVLGGMLLADMLTNMLSAAGAWVRGWWVVGGGWWLVVGGAGW